MHRNSSTDSLTSQGPIAVRLDLRPNESKNDPAHHALGAVWHPHVKHNVTAYRCTLCQRMFFTMDNAVYHTKRLHSYTDSQMAVAIAVELWPSVFYCTVCAQPMRNSYQWQMHMRRRHNIRIDRRRRLNANSRWRQLRRFISFRDKSFTPIQCTVCGKEMRLTHSYYLHIRRFHMDSESFSTALAHLSRVRASRQQIISARHVNTVRQLMLTICLT